MISAALLVRFFTAPKGLFSSLASESWEQVWELCAHAVGWQQDPASPDPVLALAARKGWGRGAGHGIGFLPALRVQRGRVPGRTPGHPSWGQG